MKKNIYYNARDLYFQFDNFTPIDEDDCGLYFLSSNTAMLCLSFLQHYGKWRNRYTYDLSVEEKQRLSEDDFDLVTEIVDKAIKELMTDACKSLQEIEFTLKHMLTIFSSNKKIFWSIDKPPEPDENNGNPYLSKGIFDSNLEYNIIKDAGNPDNPGANQLWGIGELMAKAFLDYADPNNQPMKPESIVVESLLKAGSAKSLEEIEYTLKTLLTLLGKDKEIKVFIDKPVLASENDANATISVNREGVFEVGSLLETNSVTEILQIAMLDDGTLQLPDINPFNLESKLDGIRTDINLTQVHFTGEWTSLFNWFASSFRESPYSPIAFLNNPFSTNTLYQMILNSLNSVEKSYIDLYIPFYGTISIPRWVATDSYLADINQNIATSFNEDFDSNTRLATNSYFRYLHTWLNSDWKLFQTVSEDIRDCICLAKDYLNGLVTPLNAINTTLNSGLINFVGGAHLLTIAENLGFIKGAIDEKDVCCDDQTQAITNTINNLGDTISNVVNNLGDIINNDNGTTTIDNGDGTYITLPNININMPITNAPIQNVYPPLDPANPTGETSAPYKPVTVVKSNRHNALCGFTYYYANEFANWLDYIASWLSPMAYFYNQMSSYKATKTVLESSEILDAVGFSVRKIPESQATSLISGYFLLDMALGEVASGIRFYAEEFACGTNGKQPISSKAQFMELVLGSLPISSPATTINYAGFVAGLFWDYYGGSDTENSIINMNDYAQYCPCPLEGLFNGDFWNGVTGNGEKWLHLESDGVYLAGTSTSMDLFGTLYESEIVNGLIDVNNELAAGGTLHVISHTGFPDSGFTMSTNVGGTEIYFGNPSQTYTKQ